MPVSVAVGHLENITVARDHADDAMPLASRLVLHREAVRTTGVGLQLAIYEVKFLSIIASLGGKIVEDLSAERLQVAPKIRGLERGADRLVGQEQCSLGAQSVTLFLHLDDLVLRWDVGEFEVVPDKSHLLL